MYAIRSYYVLSCGFSPRTPSRMGWDLVSAIMRWADRRVLERVHRNGLIGRVVPTGQALAKAKEIADKT